MVTKWIPSLGVRLQHRRLKEVVVDGIGDGQVGVSRASRTSAHVIGGIGVCRRHASAIIHQVLWLHGLQPHESGVTNVNIMLYRLHRSSRMPFYALLRGLYTYSIEDAF